MTPIARVAPLPPGRPSDGDGHFKVTRSQRDRQMTMEQAPHKPSFKEGYTFRFTDDACVIEARCSAWNGMERVFVNNREVSSRLSISLSTTHRFEEGGHDYEMVINMVSFLTGAVQVWLLKDGELIGRDQQSFYHRSGGRIMPAFAKYFIIGAVSGFCAVMLLNWLT